MVCTLPQPSQAQASGAPDPQILIAGTDLVYVSDYFSFVGADANGHVAFALDTNRGRDGDAYQAEHFVVLYNEHQGWIDAAGTGFFANTKHELLPIPDSPVFQFTGTPQTGLTIASPVNHLVLTIAPLPERVARGDAETIYRMGSAAATLTWRDRTIHGRVIYEYFVKAHYNRLTRTYLGSLKQFQGLYLLAADSDDFYVHHTEGDLGRQFGPVLSFAAIGDQTKLPVDLRFEVTEQTFALGFYRWPLAWHLTWQGQRGPASLTLRITDWKTIKNWVLGGFAMSIVQGEMAYDGRTQPVFGFGELIL